MICAETVPDRQRALLFLALAVLLPLLYVIRYAPYGFEGTDTGFILGNSWQIVQGKALYSDVVYIRPPVSVYFHSMFLLAAGKYALIVSRIFFYLQIFIYSLLCLSVLQRYFEKIIRQEKFYFLLSVGFLLSVHNFPPMAWHTIDGIFFSVIGLFFIYCFQGNTYLFFLGSFAVFLGVLTKQSYYILPFATFVAIWVVLGRRRALQYAVLTVFWVVSYCLVLVANRSFDDFIRLTSGQTCFADLLQVGFYRYLVVIKKGWYMFLLFFIALYCKNNKKNCQIHKIFFDIFLGLMIAVCFYYYKISNKFIYPPKNFHDIAFLLACILIGYELYRNGLTKKLTVVMHFFVLVWSVSISWGYATTALFSMPAVFVLASIDSEDSDSGRGYFFWRLTVIVMLVAIYALGYRHLYGGGDRAAQTRPLQELYDRGAFIKTDQKTYDKYAELRELLRTVNGTGFTVMPSGTLVHFLTDTVNPIGVDWLLNAEINDDSAAVLQRLERTRPLVLVENGASGGEGRYGSAVTQYVKDHWKVVQVGAFFTVFRHPGESSTAQ